MGKVLRFNGIKQGIENTNYFVQTEKAKLILTIYEKRVDENDLPFFIGLMRNLFDSSFKCPEPIINKNGNYISEILKPRMLFASSNLCFAIVEVSYKSLPIPGYCAPCPGKTSAFMKLILSY